MVEILGMSWHALALPPSTSVLIFTPSVHFALSLFFWLVWFGLIMGTSGGGGFPTGLFDAFSCYLLPFLPFVLPFVLAPAMDINQCLLYFVLLFLSILYCDCYFSFPIFNVSLAKSFVLVVNSIES
jgi:hypothetical protein